jgi:PAS domain S-box-containing protein
MAKAPYDRLSASLKQPSASPKAITTLEAPARKRLQRVSASRFRGLVELAPDATVVTDRDGQIVLVNRQTELLFGYTREELLGQPVEQLLPGRFHAVHREHRASYLTAPHQRPMGADLPLCGRHRDGHEFAVEVSLSPLQEVGELLLIASIRDISARQRLEAAHAAAEAAGEELRQLQAITDIALIHPTLEALLPALLDRIRSVLAVDNVAILLVSEDGQALTLHAVQGPEASLEGQVRVPIGRGVAGRIAATRQPLIIDDLATVEVVNPLLQEQFRSLVGVPLVVEDRLIGVLHADSTTPRQFTEKDARLLQLVAERIAYAIDRARLHEALRTAHEEVEATNRELRQLQVITDSALSHLAVDELLQALLDRIHSVMEVEDIAILLLDAEGQHLKIRAARGLADAQATKATIPVGQGFSGRVAAARAPLRVDDLAAFDIHYRQMRATQQSAVGVPLLVEDRLLGVVYVGSAVPRRFSEHDVQLLQRVADRMALAIDRARLFEAEQAARREAERQAAQLDRTFEAMADGVGIYDAQGKVLRENPAVRRLLGLDTAPPGYYALPARERVARYTARDDQGRLLAPDQIPLLRALRGEVLTGAAAMGLQLRTLDGRAVELSVSAAPLRHRAGGIVGAVCIFHDLTEQNRLKRERDEALRSSEAWFRSMADTAPVLLWVAGTDGLVTFVNAPWLHFTGRRLEHELGNGWADRVHPDDYERCLETYRTAFEARQHFTMEYRLRRADGEYRWLVDSGVPRWAADGTFLGYIGSAIDITERRRLEREHAEQAAQLDRLFEQTAEPLLVYDAEGQIARVNAAARRMLGLDAAAADYFQRPQLERLALYALRDGQGRTLAPEEAPQARALRGEVLTGADAVDLQLRALDGREVEVLISAAPVRDQAGQIVGALASGVEMTERHRLEREREAARTSELAAQEVIRRLDTFIGMAAHDLRSPLTVSTLQLQIAKNKVRKAAAERHQGGIAQEQALARATEALEAAERSHDRLLRLVALLLDVSRARTGTLRLQKGTCRLDALVRECVEEQRLLTPGRALALELELADSQPVLVTADIDRLGQVLTNYLTNAVRYTPEDRPIQVALRVAQEGARVEVRDQGPGIPPEELETIWERFQRTQATSDAAGQGVGATGGTGLGLGLYIVKRLVELHGGTVGVASQLGHGATFWFTLPFARQAEAST